MKTLITTTAVLLAFATAAQAQAPIVPPDIPSPPEPTGGTIVGTASDARYGYHASTLQEGVARGLADQARSAGLYNRLSAEAALYLAEARRTELQNAQDSTDIFYNVRQKIRDYRAAARRPRLSRETLIRLAEAAKPDRLTSSQLDELTGQLAWPLLLRGEAFADHRAELEELFSQRADNRGIPPDDFLKVKELTEALKSELKDRVHHLPMTEYASAKRFLKSLAYEAKLPVGPLPGIAGEVEGR